MYSLYSSLIINISLLVLIATLLTKITFVKQVMAEEHAYRTMDQLILVVIFGGFCIFSTCSGVRVNAVIKNRDNVVCFLSRRLKISHTKEPIAPSKSVDIAHASEVNPVGS